MASESSAQGGPPTRKRKPRKVCAPESLPKILQVDSLPEVWASLAQRPALRHSGWFLELLVGRGVLEIKPCFWQVWTFSGVQGEPIFLCVFFSSIVKSIGVVSGAVEPCLYVGRMVGKDQAPIVIMAYVDDLLVATTSESATQDTHDCTVSSCQGSRDWPRWFESGTLAFPWSKYLSKARLICFVHAGGSNVLG